MLQGLQGFATPGVGELAAFRVLQQFPSFGFSLREIAYAVSGFFSFREDRILVAKASDTPAPMEMSAAVA